MSIFVFMKKLLERKEIFIKLVDLVESIEKLGYTYRDIPTIKDNFQLQKPLNSDTNGFWEGFYLYVNEFGVELTYKKKLANSLSTLNINSKLLKTVEELEIEENRFIEIGKLFL